LPLKRKASPQIKAVNAYPSYAIAAAVVEKLFSPQEILAICRGCESHYQVSLTRKAFVRCFMNGKDSKSGESLHKDEGPIRYMAGIDS
jgi:hypothetical protein